MITNVSDYLENTAKKYPDKICCVEGEHNICYSRLLEDAKRIASCLIRREDTRRLPIMVFMEKGIQMLTAFQGIAMSGNIYIPMDIEAPAWRIESIMDVSQSRIVITNRQAADRLPELFASIEVFYVEDLLKEEVDEKAVQERREQIIDTDPLYIMFTSGSTGIPKGVVLPHRAIIDFTEECSERMHFTKDERILSQVSFCFDISVLDIYCTIRNAAQLHIVPKQFFVFPIMAMEYISKHRISAFIWVPSAMVLAANYKVLKEEDISCLKKVLFCGEVMPVKQLNMWREALPEAMFVNYYGPTEATCTSTFYIVNREFTLDETLPIGYANKNTGAFILTEEGKEASVGEVGELCLSGSCLALGYYNDPDRTQEVFIQNPLHHNYRDIVYKTGDLVKRNENGEIVYLGRKDFQIKHMGYRIELPEIENVINQMDEVGHVCCIYRREEKRIVLFVVASCTEKELSAYAEQNLPQYMMPGEIHILERLPLNTNGKIDRKRLEKGEYE